jgi:2-oxoglutarate ferredoxin oxidoreductase subunit alpha
MILGDGLIGQMMEPVEFPDHLKTVPSDKDEWAVNGMETRKSDRRNLIRSLYLDPEKLNEHNLILKAKYDRMKKEEVRFEAYNTDGDYRVLIVSYGTMSRVCRTAIDQLKERGVDVGMIRPQTVFPFPETAVEKAAGKKKLPGGGQHRNEHGPDGGRCGACGERQAAGSMVRKMRR